MKRIGDEIIGQKYGRLTVLALTGRDKHGKLVFCECECGSKTIKRAPAIRSGQTLSCGCLAREMNESHGCAHKGKITPEYRAWTNMKERCYNTKAANYSRYGGRGITVCERWAWFENFLSDMGPKPSPQHTLDRYPNLNGHYEPSNCRWASKAEQTWNRRVTIWIERNGVKKPLGVWAKELGFNRETIHNRYTKGWPLDKLFIPADKQQRILQ